MRFEQKRFVKWKTNESGEMYRQKDDFFNVLFDYKIFTDAYKVIFNSEYFT